MSRASDSKPRRQQGLRCAIYTRKSSEEGLDQAFNSLDAQREACEAFIKSQRHEGWICLGEAYDDGGISGATMDRPALQQLLCDIRAGKVDTVIVYKVDRLTRSLADFAKIVEIFDAKGVSFVSVTQQFNTTTSMGRLTLNVLLSFAQFEREVTGERIRDKIAASKRKGMWMGGVPPLGYTARERKLIVIDGEAETVRHIFRRYAALGSVRLLKTELDAQGIVSKCWTSAAGRSWGGRPIARGALYLILQNPIYRGEIVHKDQSYPGEHPAIVDPPLWDEVQRRLAANTVDQRSGKRAKHPSLLAGLLFDGDGHRMTPTHAVKNGIRYRYYVSCPLTTGTRADAPAGRRLPAAEIEQIVTDRIRQWLGEPAAILVATPSAVADAQAQQQQIAGAAALAAGWSELSPMQQRAALAVLIKRVDIAADRVDIALRPDRLDTILGDGAIADELASPDPAADEPTSDSIRRGAAVPQRKGDQNADRRRRPRWRTGKTRPDLDQADRSRPCVSRQAAAVPARKTSPMLPPSMRISASYLTRVARLAYLAPDIVNAILDGHQPRHLTAAKLLDHSRLPLAWRRQHEALGFA